MDQPTPERWLPVPGYESRYEVSDHGRVWGIRSRIYLRWGYAAGYPMVILCKDGKTKRFIHRLVAEAFIGHCPAGKQVRHLDGDRLNPRLDNLVYGTPSENEYDKVEHGTHQQASKTHCKHGHEFAKCSRLVIRKSGRRERVCLICQKNRMDAFIAKKKAA